MEERVIKGYYCFECQGEQEGVLTIPSLFRFLHTLFSHLLCIRGEGGIRTPGTLLGVRQFSKLLLSATQAPLLISIKFQSIKYEISTL